MISRGVLFGALIGGVLLLTPACATQDPDRTSHAETRRRLGHVKLERGQYELAVREYKKALEVYSEDAETHFGLSEAYRRKGVYDLAEQHLLEALRIDPEHQSARLNLSVVYLQLERWPEAIREATALIDDHTFLRPVRAYVNRGWAHYKSGNLDAAEADYREAIAQEGSNFQAHLNYGILRYERGEIVESIREFERVVELLDALPQGAFDGAEAEAHFRLAQAYVKLGKRDKAIGSLEVAVERGGEGLWGEKSKEYLAVLQ